MGTGEAATINNPLEAPHTYSRENHKKSDVMADADGGVRPQEQQNIWFLCWMRVSTVCASQASFSETEHTQKFAKYNAKLG